MIAYLRRPHLKRVYERLGIIQAEVQYIKGKGKMLFQSDVYKTRTPSTSPWTTPVDLVYGPLDGTGPWTTPVNHR